jgi:serine/threonine protein kinase
MRYKDVAGRFLGELRTLCSLEGHPHIVSYRGHEFSFISSDCGEAIQLTLFMDYVKGSSLEVMLFPG